MMWVDVLVFAALFVAAASPLVMVHELGHFMAARAAGMRVVELNLGAGPAILKRAGRGGTIYRVGVLPLGAYCGLDKRSYRDGAAGWRLVVSAAGSTANFLLALLIFVAIAPFHSGVVPVVDVVAEGPAMQGGLRSGDRIVAVDSVAVDDWQDVGLRFVSRMGDSGVLAFDVERGGDTSRHEVGIDRWESGRRQIDPFASLGLSRAATPAFHEESAWARLGEGVTDTFAVGFATASSGIRMLAGELSVLNFGGGLWLAMQGEDHANLLTEHDREALPWPVWLKLLAMLSIGLGMINLLPGPLVDGSGVISALLSMLTGRPLSERVDRWLVIGGSVVGFGPLVLCTYYETMRFF